MSVDEKKNSKRETLEREIEAAVAEETAGLEPSEAEKIREKVRARVLEEVERERRIRTAAERRAEERRRREEKRQEKHPEEGEMFQRFNQNFRFQHIVMFTSVILLIITPKDARDLVQNNRHFLGKAPEKPRFGRFSYIEKFDYWAVYWGCVIMIGSGLFLWFEMIVLKYFPKYVLDVAHEMHSDEAMLATLAIVIWHFYNVHFNPDRFPGTLMWWHGQISEHEMKEEHPLEYEEIMAKRSKQEPAEVAPR